MIKGVIFDMDGLLVDSEPIWEKVQAEVFSSCGVKLQNDDFSEIKGMKIDQVIAYLFRKHGRTLTDMEQIRDKVTRRMVEEIRKNGKEKDGAGYILDFMKKKRMRMAIASSSPMDIINAVIEKLGISSYFDELYSAEYERYGKPHPAVYISSARRIGVLPELCLAFEDSINGLRSAKSARMKCVGVPDGYPTDDPKLEIADMVLPSLEYFDEDVWEELNGGT